jgi:hypothetical protein
MEVRVSGKLAMLATVGEIARRFDVPIHRIEFVIRTREIQAIGRAGHAWVYGETGVQAIGRALQEIEDRRKERARGSSRGGNEAPGMDESTPNDRAMSVA